MARPQMSTVIVAVPLVLHFVDGRLKVSNAPTNANFVTGVGNVAIWICAVFYVTAIVAVESMALSDFHDLASNSNGIANANLLHDLILCREEKS